MKVVAEEGNPRSPWAYYSVTSVQPGDVPPLSAEFRHFVDGLPRPLRRHLGRPWGWWIVRRRIQRRYARAA